jgi:hypothetical protein
VVSGSGKGEYIRSQRADATQPAVYRWSPQADPLAGSRKWTSPAMASESHRWWMNELLVVYARVSTEQQDLTSQRNGLHALGVGDDRIYVGHGLTSTNRDRPGCRSLQSARTLTGDSSSMSTVYARHRALH